MLGVDDALDEKRRFAWKGALFAAALAARAQRGGNRRHMLSPIPIKEAAMAVVLVHQGPSVTQEAYEEIVRKVSDGKSRMESPSDWPVAGLLVHVAGQADGGFRVVDVWESEEACNQFGEILAPILKEVGVDDPPEQIYQAHTFVSA
jgi:hypothetical protein